MHSVPMGEDFKVALKSVANFTKQDLSSLHPAVLSGHKFQTFLQLCYSATDNKQMASVNSLTNLPTVGSVSTNMI